jgi:Potential Monad-binding region of RPAP3
MSPRGFYACAFVADHAGVPAWSIGRDGKPIGQLARQQAQLPAQSLSMTDQVPKTAHHFERDWKRCCPDGHTRYMFLRRIGSETLQQLFKVEIKSTLLGDILQALAACWAPCNVAKRDACGHQLQAMAQRHGCSAHDAGIRDGADDERGDSGAHGHNVLQEASWVLTMLQALAECGRFQLSQQLLPQQVCKASRQLLLDLLDAAKQGKVHAVDGFTEQAVLECAARYGLKL